MKQVTQQEFIAFLKTKGSAVLGRQLENLSMRMVLGYHEDCYIYEGDLAPGDEWQPEVANLIVVGSLNSSGFINAQSSSEDVEEGGSLWVLGDVECLHFANDYGKSVFVDGNMSVSGLAVNAFEDACLVVTENFICRYFYGSDIWVEGGGKIEIEYGIGYGLPIGYEDAEAQAVYPRHDEESSRALLGFPDGCHPDGLIDKIRSREEFFSKV